MSSFRWWMPQASAPVTGPRPVATSVVSSSGPRSEPSAWECWPPWCGQRSRCSSSRPRGCPPGGRIRSYGEPDRHPDVARPGAGGRASAATAARSPRRSARWARTGSARCSCCYRDPHRDRLGEHLRGLVRVVLGDPPDGRRRRPAARLHAARPRQRRAHGDLLLHRRSRGAARVRDRRAHELVDGDGPRRRGRRRTRGPGAAVRPDRGRIRPGACLGGGDLDRHRLPRRSARAHRTARTGSPPGLPARARGRRRHRRAQHHRARLHRELQSASARRRGRRVSSASTSRAISAPDAVRCTRRSRSSCGSPSSRRACTRRSPGWRSRCWFRCTARTGATSSTRSNSPARSGSPPTPSTHAPRRTACASRSRSTSACSPPTHRTSRTSSFPCSRSRTPVS